MAIKFSLTTLNKNYETSAYNFLKTYLVKSFTISSSIWLKTLFFKINDKITNPIKTLIYTSFKSKVKKHLMICNLNFHSKKPCQSMNI